MTTHLFLSITSNRLEVSTEPSKSADRELAEAILKLDTVVERNVVSHYVNTVTKVFLTQNSFYGSLLDPNTFPREGAKKNWLTFSRIPPLCTNCCCFVLYRVQFASKGL